MRTTGRWSLTVVLCVFAGVIPALAQTGSETFIETISWLQANLGGAACIVFGMGAPKAVPQEITENTEVLFVGCDMTLATSNTAGPDVRVQTYRIQLGQLNPAEVKLSEGIQVPAGWITTGEIPTRTLRLVTASQAKLIGVKQEQFGDHAPNPFEYKAAEIRFHIRNEQTADKVAKAFTRAITLCGGK